MVNSCRIFTYSPNNKYANDYYNACKHFDDVREKVIAYEHNNNDRSSVDYQKLMREFKFWDAEVPKTSNIAGREEERLAKEKTLAQNGRNEQTIDYYA